MAMSATSTRTTSGSSGPSDTGAVGGVRAIVVNGERRMSAAATIAELLIEAGYGEAKVATARNGEFVPARARAATPLVEGDHIEIVAPRQGG